jgi:hypothetical protein
LSSASLAFFTLTFVEREFEQPLDHPATSPATIPTTIIFGPDDRALAFMKSKLSSLQVFARRFTSRARIRRIKEGKAPTCDDLVSLTADRLQTPKGG